MPRGVMYRTCPPILTLTSSQKYLDQIISKTVKSEPLLKQNAPVATQLGPQIRIGSQLDDTLFQSLRAGFCEERHLRIQH